jgi:hypothetical protein
LRRNEPGKVSDSVPDAVFIDPKYCSRRIKRPRRREDLKATLEDGSVGQAWRAMAR